jgi:hypothetical protein
MDAQPAAQQASQPAAQPGLHSCREHSSTAPQCLFFKFFLEDTLTAKKSSHSLGWENEDEIKKFPTHANIFVLLEFIPKDSRMVVRFQLDEFCSILRMHLWLQPLVDVPGCLF